MARPLHPRLRLTPSVRYAEITRPILGLAPSGPLQAAFKSAPGRFVLAVPALSGGSAATNVPVSLASTGLPWPVDPDNAVLLGSR